MRQLGNLYRDFIELSDGTIVNAQDIILVNVEQGADGNEYRLYLRGKKMTLKLCKKDYDILHQVLIVL